MTDLIAKLAEVQAELHAPKNQRNTFANFDYRSAEDILEAVKPLLHARGMVVTISDTLECIGDRYYVKAIASVQDGDEHVQVSAYAREGEERKGYDPSQLTGATSSYARKYALNGLFAIDDARDTDTNAHTQQRQQETHQRYEQESQQPRPQPTNPRRLPANNPPPESPQQQQQRTGYNGPQRGAGEGGPATDRQKEAIHKMAGKAKVDHLDIFSEKAAAHETWDDMTKGTAGLIITELGVILDQQQGR